MIEGGRFVAHRAREVAVEIGHRGLDAVCQPPPGARLVHPRAATLGFAGVGVQVELADEFAIGFLDAEKAHVLVPRRGAVGFDHHTVECLDHVEESRQHLRFGEIALDLLLGKGVALLPQLFRGVADIPGFQGFQRELPPGEFFQFLPILEGEGPGLGRQIAQKDEHLVHRSGHLRHQREFGIVGVAEQLRFFGAQLKEAANQRRVVERSRPEFGGAGRRSPVERGTQTAAVGKLHDRPVGRHVQGEFPARFAVLFRRRTGRLADIRRQAGEFGLVTHVFGKGIGRIKQVFGELRGQRVEFFLDRLKTWFLFFRQFGTREAKITHFVVDDALAGG